MSEGNSEPVIAEAIGRTRNPLKSIAELGLVVRDARKAMKMNQAEFAAHAGVGRRFVSELEGGKPSLEFDKVLACAGAAGVDLFAKKRRA
jgi:y4mF family transcriptional regulator